MSDPEIKLNTEQQQAVTYDEGPLLIIAGAGTGKTAVITERIKWLIQEGRAKPEEILALTFTDKAAAEMEERVDVALPLGYNRTWIMTFHGFCERVLRQDAVQIGLDSGFSVLSQAEQQLFIKENLYKFELDYYRPQGNPGKFIGGLVTHFSRLKDEDVSPEKYIEWTKDVSSSSDYDKEEIEKYKELSTAYQKYEELKVQHSVMDFGDLISNTLKLFRQRPSVLKSYQKQFKYVLIDEFQDTNYAQNHLAIMLAGDDRRITVVADDDQSIYRWRGGAVYNVLDFKNHFSEAKLVTLTKNYRSIQPILDCSYELLQHNNPDRLESQEGIEKKLESRFRVQDSVKKEESVGIIWEDRVEDEAEQVVSEISKIVGLPDTSVDKPINQNLEMNFQPKDIAILVRANNHAEPFIRALRRYGIPYQFLGPGKLFRQNEVKELIAYLRFLYSLEDNVALYKVLSMSVFKFSGRDLTWVMGQARKQNVSVFEILESLVHDEDAYRGRLKVATIDHIRKFVDMVHRHLDLVKHTGAGQVLYYFLEDTGMLKHMRDPQNEIEMKRIENISAFFDVIKKFESRTSEARLDQFVEYLDFLMHAGESPAASTVDWTSQNAVNILTVHSAKGLEFPVVFLVNLVNLRFPTTNRRDQIPLPDELIKEPEPSGNPHLQEERRLFYVGITRAQDKLYLTGAKFYHDGSAGSTARPKKISPFIREALGDDLEPFRLSTEKAVQNSLFEIESFKDQDNVSETESGAVEKIVNHRVTYLSYSQIENFKTCPLHYKLDYIIRIPKLPSGALNFGTVMHDTLNHVYHQIKTDQLPKDFEQVFPEAIEYYKKHWTSVGFVSKEHAEKRYESGKKILEDFLQKDMKNDAEVLRLEEPFTFNISSDLKVGGRIDRIDRHSDGTIEIVDYKTGQLPRESELKKGNKALQLSIYAMAAVNHQVFGFDLEKLLLSFYYLEAGRKISFTRTLDELGEAKNEILQVRDQIQQSDFECSGSYICQRGCDYELFCG